MSLTDDSATQAWLDQDDRRATETIRRFGTRIVYVGGTECDACAALNRADRRRAAKGKAGKAAIPFAYTVGLFGIGLQHRIRTRGRDDSTRSAVSVRWSPCPLIRELRRNGRDFVRTSWSGIAG